MFMISMFAGGKPVAIIGGSVVIPIVNVICLALLWVTFDVIMVLFRMAADLRTLIERSTPPEQQS
jgi:glycerol-3-phosphate acyltransferase PlsY